MRGTLSSVRLGALLALLGSAVPASAMEVTLSPQSVTVGDPVEVLLDVPFATDGSIPQLPAEFDSWGSAEVVNAERVKPLATETVPSDSLSREPEAEAAETERDVQSRPSDASASVRYRIELRVFRTGRIDLPPITFVSASPKTTPNEVLAVAVGASSDPWTTPAGLGFHVISVLPQDLAEGEAVEPRPMAPPRALSRRYLDRWLLAAVVSLAMIAGLLYWRRRSGGSSETRRARVSPFEALQIELDRLTQLDATETIHVDLSLALRHYLQNAAGVPAPERTTAEIQRALRTSALSPEVGRTLVQLLRSCDAVKFARLEVPDSQTRQKLRQALGVGETIEAELAALRAPTEEMAA